MVNRSKRPAVRRLNTFCERPSPEYVAHYRILGTLGKGGMGEVFLAEDTKQHGRKVADERFKQLVNRFEPIP